MKLRFEPPKSLAGQMADAIYILPFDIGADGQACDGWLTVTENSIGVFTGGQLLRALPLEGLKEIKVSPFIGCRLLEGTWEDGTNALCRFTQARLRYFAELA